MTQWVHPKFGRMKRRLAAYSCRDSRGIGRIAARTAFPLPARKSWKGMAFATSLHGRNIKRGAERNQAKEVEEIRGHLVEPSGIEPLTSSLRTTRSPN